MRRICVMTWLLVAAQATAEYSGPWHHVWDFNDGLQGWTLRAGAETAYTGRWVDPQVDPNGPMLPDADFSHAGAGNLYLPDKNYAELDVSSLGIGAGEGRKGFVLQVDVYVPNLALGGFPSNYPGSMNEGAGLQVLRDYGNGMIVEGDYSWCCNQARDQLWDSTIRRTSWTMQETAPQNEWWDDVITLQLDFGYTTAGKWSAWQYIPWESAAGGPGWIAITTGRDVAPMTIAFEKLRIGGQYSWTQAQFDNVRLAVLPEPATLILLAAGGAVLTRRCKAR